MKTALLFPGLDALFVTSKLQRWVEVPEVRASLSETNQILSQLTGQAENLERLVTASSRPHLADFDRTTIALAGIQIGIARAVQKKQSWDVVVGCSHGDIARSVVCGVLKLNDAVEIIWTFAQLRKDCPEGKTANVRTVDGSPLKDAQIEWLASQGATLSQWSTHHATVAATQDVIDQILPMSRERNLKVKPIFPFAVHSPAMSPLADQFRALSPKWELGESQWPIFSSVHAKFLGNVDEIRKEAIAGAVSAIAWTRALASLCDEHGVRRFLNVGPSNALTGWTFGSLATEGVVVQDAWDILSLC